MSEEAGTGFWDGVAMRVGEKEILQGVSTQSKATILHVLRGTAYVSLGILFVPMIVSAYGATVSAVGEIKDERLHAVTEELRMVANKEMRERRASMQERRGDPTGQGKKSAGEVWRERRERLEGKSSPKSLPDDDDMSPTGGAMMDDGGVAEEQGRLSGAGEMGGVLSDTQMRTQEVRAQPEKGKSPTENRASTFQMEKVSRQPKTFDDDYDDASPTGGRGAMDDDGAGGFGGGSVWERIRQQQASSGSSATTQSRGRRGGIRQEQQEGSTTGDSFSFSRSEEERNYAKDEAQREFDERVEKERRGGDFSSGSEKRW